MSEAPTAVDESIPRSVTETETGIDADELRAYLEQRRDVAQRRSGMSFGWNVYESAFEEMIEWVDEHES